MILPEKNPPFNRILYKREFRKEWIAKALVPQLITWLTIANAVTFSSTSLFIIIAWEKVFSLIIIFFDQRFVINRFKFALFELIFLPILTYSYQSERVHQTILKSKIYFVYLILLPLLVYIDSQSPLDNFPQILIFISVFFCILGITFLMIIHFSKSNSYLNSTIQRNYGISITLSIYQVIFTCFWSDSLSELALWATFNVGFQAILTWSLAKYLLKLPCFLDRLAIVNYIQYFFTSISQFDSNSQVINTFARKQTSKIILKFKVVQFILFLILAVSLGKYKIPLFACILLFPCIAPHLVYIYQNRDNNSLVIFKLFYSKKELISFITANKHYDQIVIVSQRKQTSAASKQVHNKNTQAYLPMEEDENKDTADKLSSQEAFLLLETLYTLFYQKNKLLSIEQYGIFVNEFAFIVEHCVSLMDLKLYLCNSVENPIRFFASKKYKSLNLFEISLSRTLQLLPIDYDCEFDLYKMKKNIIPQVLQVNAYVKILAKYQFTNPRIVLYDLFEI